LENLFGWAPLEGIERWPHKLIRAPKGELYDLSTDPTESQNLYESQEATRVELERYLGELLQEMQPAAEPADADIAIDEQTRQSLASLGYVASSARSRQKDAAISDPKDHRASVRLYQQVMMGPDQDSTPTELDRVRQLARLEPEQPVIQELLGDFLVHFGKNGAADTAFHKAAALAPENPRPFLKLATLARLAQEDQQARDHLAAAYRADPMDATVLFEMAEQSARDQDYPRAERYYRQALEQHSEYVPALSHLAALLMLLGRQAEAEPLLRRSLQLPRENNQELAQRHYHLGIVLMEEAATRPEAIEQFLQAVHMFPQLAGAHYQLARLYAGQKRGDEAVEHARRYLALDPESPRANQMRQLLADF
jgi:tetratricopeptide (TPR) repeat protein